MQRSATNHRSDRYAISQRVKNIVTSTDHEELRKAYQFVLHEDTQDDISPEALQKTKARTIPSTSSDNKQKGGCVKEQTMNHNTTWQQRMVEKYHSHLYKSHVIADFSKQTNKSPNNIGLRWRVKAEVENGKGYETCGNKHCPCYFEGANNVDPIILSSYDQLRSHNDSDISKKWKKMKKRCIEDIIRWKKNTENRNILWKYDQHIISKGENHQNANSETTTDDDGEEEKERKEIARIQSIPYGLGLFDYTVHFSYDEHGEHKQELVQLKLCLRCAPKVFYGKGGVIGALNARRKKSVSRDTNKVGNGLDSTCMPLNEEENHCVYEGIDTPSTCDPRPPSQSPRHEYEHQHQNSRKKEKKRKRSKDRRRKQKKEHCTSSSTKNESKRKKPKDPDRNNNDDHVDATTMFEGTKSDCRSYENEVAIASEKILLDNLDNILKKK